MNMMERNSFRSRTWPHMSLHYTWRLVTTKKLKSQFQMVWPLNEFQSPSKLHGHGPRPECKVALTSPLHSKDQVWGYVWSRVLILLNRLVPCRTWIVVQWSCWEILLTCLFVIEYEEPPCCGLTTTSGDGHGVALPLAERYVDVIWFIFHVLQLLLIPSTKTELALH